MKFFKFFSIGFVSLILIIYSTFLFVLPNVINLNKYKFDICKIVDEASGLKLKFSNIKLKTTPMLKIGIVIDNVKVKYPDSKEILSVKNAFVDIPVLPLLMKTLRIDKILIDDPKVSILMHKDGTFKIQKYFENYFKQHPLQNKDNTQEFPLKISENMPDIIINNYFVSIYDEQLGKSIIVKGNNFKIDKFKLNDKIRLISSGFVATDDKKYINYDFIIETFLPEFTFEEKNTQEKFEFINPFANIIKYNFNSNLKADLKITQKKDEDIKIEGFLNVDNVSFNVKGKKIDKNFMHLSFESNKINMHSNLYVNNNEKATIMGNFKFGKNPDFKLNVNADKINVENIKDIISILFEIFNVKTQIDDFNVKGFAMLDFSLYSDMKKIQSSGKIDTQGLNISNSKIGLNIADIKSLIDFSGNKISFNNSHAVVNGSPIVVSGVVNSKAIANITVNATQLPIAKLFDAFAPVDLRKTYNAKSGYLDLNILLKGKLDNIKPKIKLALSNLIVQDKINNFTLNSALLNADLNSNLKNIEGDLNSNLIKIIFQNPKATLNARNLKVKISQNDLIINPMIVSLDNSVFKLNGNIKDYMEKPDINVKIEAKLVSNELKKYFTSEIKQFLSAKGYIPLKMSIKGDGVNNKIHLQMHANSSNYFSPITIHQLSNSSSIFNVLIKMSPKNFEIQDMSLYKTNTKNLTDDFKQNILDGVKFLSLNGTISNLNSKFININSLKIHTPNQISFSIPNMKSSNVTMKTDLIISGNANNPFIRGYCNLSNIKIPDFKLVSNLINVNLDKDTINANSSNIQIGNSAFAFDMNASNEFSNIFVINSLRVESPYIDFDSVMSAFSNMPQNSMAPGTSIPLKIVKGEGSLGGFKMGNLYTTNVKSDFNLNKNVFKLFNISTNAYGGLVKGNIDYNLQYLTAKMRLTGNNLYANPAITAFLGIKDQISGVLNFNADMKLSGSTQIQQMQSLKGNADFNITNGQLGSLGTFEHFISAQNLLSQTFIRTSIGSAINSISPHNTGKFEYLKGNLTFNNGWATISSILMAGPNMSLYINGKLNLLNNIGDINILGRISPSVASNLGVLNDLSISSLASNIPRFGMPISNILNNFNAATSAQYLANIPALTSSQTGSPKEFRVKISGNINSPTSVKTFYWLATKNQLDAKKQEINKMAIPIIDPSTVIEQTKNQVQQKIQQAVPDFVNKLPSLF